MKFAAVASTLFIASANAFAPAPTCERASTALDMDRRSVMGALATAGVVAAAVPGIAYADGAVSTASIQRAKYKFGTRIMALKDAVEKGDFAAVAAEKNAFVLYNSGSYPTLKQKDKKNKAIAATNQIFAAIRSKDKTGLKTAYSNYLKVVDMSDYGAVDNAKAQGYSSDYDYRVRTPQAAIYVR